jgi:phosphoribosylformylglycinamidine synthase
MVSVLRDLVGEPSWPSFVRNKSEQFEARTSMVEIVEGNPSVFLTEMGGSRFPVAVAHGEGRAEFANDADLEHAVANHQVAIRFVDNRGQPTEQYPYNPNGSARGITGITNANGRVLVLMPHPERCVRSVSNSWRPDDGWGGDVSPWNRMFANARRWVG